MITRMYCLSVSLFIHDAYNVQMRSDTCIFTLWTEVVGRILNNVWFLLNYFLDQHSIITSFLLFDDVSEF